MKFIPVIKFLNSVHTHNPSMEGTTTEHVKALASTIANKAIIIREERTKLHNLDTRTSK